MQFRIVAPAGKCGLFAMDPSERPRVGRVSGQDPVVRRGREILELPVASDDLGIVDVAVEITTRIPVTDEVAQPFADVVHLGLVGMVQGAQQTDQGVVLVFDPGPAAVEKVSVGGDESAVGIRLQAGAEFAVYREQRRVVDGGRRGIGQSEHGPGR